MKVETLVVKEIVGATKVITQDGLMSVIEVIVITCRSRSLWERQRVLVNFLDENSIERLNQQMPMVMVILEDDYHCREVMFIKVSDEAYADYYEHGHMTAMDFFNIISSGEIIYAC
jgi:hypothetical protein